MRDPKLPHETQRNDAPTVTPLAVYKAIAGTVLITIGVIVGVNVAILAFGLINGNDPPGMVRQLAEPAADEVVRKANENGNEFDLPADLKQVVFFFVAFLFLLLPVAIATSLITAGGKLMHGEASDALVQIAKKLKS